MDDFADSRPRAPRRRLAALAAATAVALPVLLGQSALPASAAKHPTDDPVPGLQVGPPNGIPVGGPRMAETGYILDAAAPAPPPTNAKAYVVADADTGAVLAAYDPHGRYRPASTQKTLLALTMLPRLDPNGTYTASQEDANVEGTRVGMNANQTYDLDDLWYALMLRSGNDAALGLAKAGADGDIAKAVRMMNEEARRLQAYDTTVVSPSGLDEDGQYSSAYDLALWGRAALQRGDLAKYMKTKMVIFPGNKTAKATKKTAKDFEVWTENRLLLNNFPGAIGVKMGYTTKAQNTMIAAAERDGHKVVVSLMSVGHGGITKNAGDLIDWAFANRDRIAPVGALVDPASPALVPADGQNAYVQPSVPVPGSERSPELKAAGIDTSPAAAGEDAPISLPVAAAGVLGAFAVALVTMRAVAVRRRRRRYWLNEARRRNALAAQLRADAGEAAAESGLAPASE